MSITQKSADIEMYQRIGMLLKPPITVDPKMSRSYIPLMALMFSMITFTAAVAGPEFYAPAPAPVPGVPELPPVQIIPELSPVPQGDMYLPEPQEYQTVIPYEEVSPYSPHYVELYDRVIYRDQHRKHPHAIPYLVEVPLWKPILRRRRANYCGPECALITICVPPCNQPRIRVTRHGHKLRYDFGKYEVDVVVRRDGRIIVDYDA